MSDARASHESSATCPSVNVSALRNTVLACRVPMAIFNLETACIDCANAAFAEALGYSPEELNGRSPAMLHDDSAAAGRRVRDAVDALLKTGAVLEERELKHKDGRILPFDIQGSLMVRSPVPMALMVLRDTSVRRRVELELRKLAAKFEALVDNLPAGVIFADSSGSLMQANKVAAELLGQKMVQGTPGGDYARTYSLEHEDGTPYPPSQLPIKRVLATGKPAHLDDLFVRRADGSVVQIEEWAVPISWSGGDGFDAVVALFQDITERKQQERALEDEQARQHELQEQLFRDEKMRSIATLAGGVAHDFNNILVSVLGNATLIQSEMAPDHEWYKSVSMIAQSAERGAAIAGQLLAYSRGGVFSPKRVSLSRVVQDSMPLCRSTAPRGTTIDFTSINEDDEVEVDPTQMQQILLNLTLNAAEAMLDGGSIEIRTQTRTGPAGSELADQRCVCLIVKDHGVGIDEDPIEKIFEPFYTTKQFGRGLGLASVYGMLDNHGAEVEVTSKLGEGTEFTIYFASSKG